MSNTKIYKDRDGAWTGETVFQEPDGQYSWRISTNKQSKGMLNTYAVAVTFENGNMVWDMLFAPRVDLVSKKTRATEKTVREQHQKGLGIFEAMRLAGELPEMGDTEQGNEDPADILNSLGLTHDSEGDSHLGDAWKDKVPEAEKEDPGSITIEFFAEHRLKIKGSVRDDKTLTAGFNMVDQATNEGQDLKTYKEDPFTLEMVKRFLKSVTPVLKKSKPYLFKEEDKGYTGMKRTGAKYERTKHLDITEIAKLAREEFKALFPEMKWSVRVERFSGGQAIRAEGTGYPDNPYSEAYLKLVKEGKTRAEINDILYRANTLRESPSIEVHTEQFKKDEERANKVLDQYRYQDSDGMIDYFSTNFYDSTKIDLEDWTFTLFPNDPETLRIKESRKSWAERTERAKQKAKARLEADGGRVPNNTIIKYKGVWTGLGEKVVPGVVRKSPNGRSRHFTGYDIRVIPPEHPSKFKSWQPTIKGLSRKSVVVDLEAAKLTLEEYFAKWAEIEKVPVNDEWKKRYLKKVEKAWKFARAEAGIEDKPKPKKARSSAKKTAPETPAGSFEAVEFAFDSFPHTKTGATIYVAKLKNKVDKTTFSALTGIAKTNKGYYSRFNRDGAIPGYHFKSESARTSFVEAVQAKHSKQTKTARPGIEQPEPKPVNRFKKGDIVQAPVTKGKNAKVIRVQNRKDLSTIYHIEWIDSDFQKLTWEGGESAIKLAVRKYKIGDTLEVTWGEDFGRVGKVIELGIAHDNDFMYWIEGGSKEIPEQSYKKVETESNPKNYDTWEGQVIDSVVDQAGVTRSDAQGIVQAHDFKLQQSWTKGLDPKETAKAILEKPEPKPAQAKLDLPDAPKGPSDYEEKARDIAELEQKIEGQQAGKDNEDMNPALVILDNLPKITPASAEAETGATVGVGKDISPSLTDANGYTVEGAAEYLRERFPDVLKDESEIRDTIIDILLTGKADYKEALAGDMKALKADLAEKKKQLAEELGVSDQPTDTELYGKRKAGTVIKEVHKDEDVKKILAEVRKRDELGHDLNQEEILRYARKINQLRSKESRDQDNRRGNPQTLAPTYINLLRWAENPKQYDMAGVDAPDGAKPTMQARIDEARFWNLFGM